MKPDLEERIPLTREGDSRPERKYWLRTEGSDGYEVRAKSAGQAKWRSFLSYDDAGYGRYSGDYSTRSQRFLRFLERTICHALGPVAEPNGTHHD